LQIGIKSGKIRLYGRRPFKEDEITGRGPIKEEKITCRCSPREEKISGRCTTREEKITGIRRFLCREEKITARSSHQGKRIYVYFSPEKRRALTRV